MPAVTRDRFGLSGAEYVALELGVHGYCVGTRNSVKKELEILSVFFCARGSVLF